MAHRNPNSTQLPTVAASSVSSRLSADLAYQARERAALNRAEAIASY